MSRFVRQISAVVLCLLLTVSADMAWGQRGGGDRGRGGFPGGGGPPGGGFPGGDRGRGGPPGGGFPGGSSRSPFGGGGSSDFIRRFDTNGNGTLDPDESQGRARMFLDRIVGSIPGIDLNKPVSIAKLSQAFDRAREQRARDSGSSNSGGSSRSATTQVEPLVPGFGTDEVLALPPGFGAEGELFTVKVTSQDNSEADERFRRYDSNRDGFLDRGEIARGRWSDDPFTFDRNRDGKLSPSEMAVRYAQRRVSREGSSSGSSSSRTASTSSRSTGRTSSGSASSTTASRLSGMIDGMMSRYDRNGDGVLSTEEASGSRMLSGADGNKDGKVTKEELNASFASRFGGGGGGDGGRSFGRGGGDGGRGGFFGRRESSGSPSSPGSNNPTATTTKDRLSYRFKTAVERLPEGLPPWFAQNDGNADGQVAMAEFSVSWSDRTLADFRQFDLNLDGIVTAAECLQATDDGAVRGTVASTSSYAASPSRSRSGTRPRPTSLTTKPAAGTPAAGTRATGTPATGTPATAIPAAGGIDPRTLDFSRKTLGKYDTNADGSLQKEEWSKMSSNPATADTDGDGKISVEELAGFYTRK